MKNRNKELRLTLISSILFAMSILFLGVFAQPGYAGDESGYVNYVPPDGYDPEFNPTPAPYPFSPEGLNSGGLPSFGMPATATNSPNNFFPTPVMPNFDNSGWQIDDEMYNLLQSGNVYGSYRMDGNAHDITQGYNLPTTISVQIVHPDGTRQNIDYTSTRGHVWEVTPITSR